MRQRQPAPLLYLASRYSRREEMQGYAAQLRDLGLARVDCKWLTEPHDWDGSAELNPDGTPSPSLAAAQQYALDDIRDIERCHVVVVFLEEAGEYRRGGSLVELGLAIGLGKHTVLVGPAPNVFTTLPSIPRFDGWAGALSHLVMWKDAMEAAAIRSRLLQ